MSKDPSNPFSQLNARDFPSRSRKEAVQKLHRSKTVVKDKAHEEAVRDEDEELFMQAMGGTVRSLDDRKEVRKGKKTAESGRFALHEDDSFAQALKASQVVRLQDKKKTVVLAQQPEQKSEDEEPSTLTAMALAGIRIARDTEDSSLQDKALKGNEEEDSRDFLKAIRGTLPLNVSGRDIPPELEPQPVPYAGRRHPLQDFMDGKVEFSVASTDEYAEGHVVGLDLSIVAQLQSRQFSPEAHIDLHGLNSEQAFHALVGFFRSSYYKGVRMALVVTGRGLNSPNGMPVLRSRVQEWFTQEPFKRVVLAFCSAKQEDGGAGAFYVLLRRYKKSSGKISWEAMPSDPDLYL